jgi:Flp pilus assembly protein TadG
MRRVIFHRGAEKGAVAIIVAILFGFGVMVGAGALTIDVGNINAERRQLQNGADAASLSAAADCAKGACPAPGNANLATLVNSNAADGHTKVARVDGGLAVCGSGPGLTACSTDPDTKNLQECPAATIPSGAKGNVRVYTQTLDASGTKTILPYSFGAAIAGAGTGANQQTCAGAAWGPGPGGKMLPTTFSQCEWLAATAGGLSYAPKPPYTPPLPTGFERKILLSDSSVSGPPACKTWLGHDLPGGFGWVTGTSTCEAVITGSSWMDVSTGTAVTDNSCKTIIPADLYSVVHIPVFDCMDPVGNYVMATSADCRMDKVTGTKAWYHVAGFAAFYLTGWKLNGMTDQAPLNSANTCTGGQTCLYGWFTQDLQQAGEIKGDPGSEDLGLHVIQVIQ